jgi:probable HAF family extracellular repeat protein
MKNKRLLITILLLLGFLLSVQVSEAEQYYYYDLRTSSCFTSTCANSINDSENIVGCAFTDNNSQRAFLWTPSSGMQNLGIGLQPYGYSGAYGINNNSNILGVINGYSVLWNSQGNASDLGFTGGANINNSGAITGSMPVSFNISQAFLWSSSEGVKYLGTLGGNNSYGTNINDNNYVIGSSEINIASSIYHAFLWTPMNGIQDLNTLAANLPNNTFLSISKNINNNNQIVGQFSVTGPGGFNDSGAFLWTATDGFKDLGTLCSNPLGASPGSWANSINNNSQIVGYSVGSDGNYNAFIWTRSSGIKDLNNLVTNLPTGTTLSDARDINNNGQIVGVDSNNHAFMLTPKSLSKTYGLFIGVWDGPGKPSAHDIRGDDSAILLSSSFNNLPNVVYNKYLTGDLKNGWGISTSDIESKINEIKNTIQPGDKLFIYVMGHGSQDLISGHYQINIGKDLLQQTIVLTDDKLTNMLQGLDTISKYIILDSCNSGGFWGDLSNLKNRALIAAAPAGQDAYAEITTGYGILSLDLTNGFLKSADTIKADGDGNKDLTFKELSDWAKNWDGLQNYDGTIVTEMDLGDQTVFNLDKWNPVFLKSDDFVDGLATGQVPIPCTIYLLGSGLLCICGLGIMKKFGN